MVVDYYNRYFEIEILKFVLCRDIVDSLDRIFARHGIPVSMKTDNGPQFISSECKNYMTTNGVQPQGNGEVERQSRTLLESIGLA